MTISEPEQPLRLGTRSSPLAMAQAREARDRLCSAHGWSADAVEIVSVRATGDTVQDRPLAEIGGKALWTKELDAALMTGEIHFAVHSAKDIETLRPPQIAIAAVLPREDVRDVLVGAESIAALPEGAVVGTSAPRRAAQLLNIRPDCRVVPIRGNVATRLAKLEAGEADATFLALAGLNRLGENGTGVPLDPDEWLPAPGQAAIALEYRADDEAMRGALASINDSPSHNALLAERALLAALGGNCHSPVAAITRLDGDHLELRAALFSPDGSSRIDGSARFSSGSPDGPEELARDLLARADDTIRACFASGGATAQ